jgi:hypothetical protein
LQASYFDVPVSYEGNCQTLNFAERNKMKLTLILSSMFLACSIHAQTVQSLQAQIAQLTQLQTQVAQLQAQVAALQQSPVQAIAPYVSIDFNIENGVVGPNITFHGANIHVVNGSGSTNATNGLGNLIIRYDEAPTTLAGARGGSHNLVMGTGNKFTTWAPSGIVNGDGNMINGQECVILTGNNNRVTGNLTAGNSAYGVIVTGYNQQIFDGQGAAIVGGTNNDVENFNSVILGGNANGNAGILSVILGGGNNVVTQDGYGIILPDVGPHFGIRLPALP